MGGPTYVDRLGLCFRLHNFIVAFASEIANVAIVRFKTVFCMLLVHTTIFLTFSIIPEVIRWLVLPIHPYAFITPLHPFCHGLIVVVFLLRHLPTFLWQYSHIKPPEARKGTMGCLG